MNVVAASMHHAHLLARVIFCFHFAGVRQTSLFINRESVEFGSHQHGWPGAVLHYRDDAVAGPFGVFVLADALSHSVSESPQLIGEERRRFFLVMRELRRSM